MSDIVVIAAFHAMRPSSCRQVSGGHIAMWLQRTTQALQATLWHTRLLAMQ